MVLTSRLALLLQTSPEERFRVLALTFTNLAAAEMTDRVKSLMGGAISDRQFIGTFHSFCIEVLQSHGAQIGLSSGFRIFSQDADREAVLSSALRRIGEEDRYDSKRVMLAIDRLRSQLVVPTDAEQRFGNAEQGHFVARAYQAFEDALAEAEAQDFNGLIMQTWRLFNENPGLAQRYRRTFRYWLVDEFQDTNRAQYGLLKVLAGNEFRELFVVADDDQIIYRWNGASYQQIEKLRQDFQVTQIQLPTNYRCPPTVVAAANALISHNRERTSEKSPLIASKLSASDAIQLSVFDTDTEECQGISKAIGALPVADRDNVVVLARNRSLLEKCQTALVQDGIRAIVSTRRDQFASAEYNWLHAVLRQLSRPQDTKNMEFLASSFEAISGVAVNVADLVDEQVSSGKSLIQLWVEAMSGATSPTGDLVAAADTVAKNPGNWRTFIELSSQSWPKTDEDVLPVDVDDDKRAWGQIVRDANSSIGKTASLDEFLHRVDISSKEPVPEAGTVRLMTIHGAKGKEFRYVFLMGLAEGELPSWQSTRPGADAEIEEERRACFVAITRTEERLFLSRSKVYRSRLRSPSRFLREMLVETAD